MTGCDIIRIFCWGVVFWVFSLGLCVWDIKENMVGGCGPIQVGEGGGLL
jgi:hypothetical protein